MNVRGQIEKRMATQRERVAKIIRDARNLHESDLDAADDIISIFSDLVCEMDEEYEDRRYHD